MSIATITKHAVPHDGTGYDLTASGDFSTLSTGSGNGVKFTHESNLWTVLKNDSGGSATFTLKVSNPASITAYGGSITSPTRVVADGHTVILRLDDIFKGPSDGFVYIECNVAGKVLVLAP